MSVLREFDAITPGASCDQQKRQNAPLLHALVIPGLMIVAFLLFHSALLANEGSAKEINRLKTDGYKGLTTGRADTTIRGKVVDSTGSPLSGVSVSVSGTQVGTTTNTAGEFVIRGVPANATLVITNVGYEAREIAIRPGQTNVAVTLNRTQGVLADVIVTGFQRISRRNFTGAATTLKAEDVKIEGMADVGRMLEGRAAGVAVQNVSSTFGSAPKIRIRGATSINGENKPLWVVDGVVLEDIVNISNDQLSSGDPTTLLGSAIAGISPSDIESFDILKDAAATALYGARAMNGVVVITTKRGRAGKAQISYTGNFSSQLKPRYADYNIMNSAQQMSVWGVRQDVRPDEC